MAEDSAWGTDWGDPGFYDYGSSGGTDWGDSSTYDPNQNTWDPAGAYYQPSYNPDSGINPYSLPSGSGMYSVGENDWQPIQTPTYQTQNSYYDQGGGRSPSGSPSYSPYSGGSPQAPAGGEYGQIRRNSLPGSPMGGGGGGQQPYQRIQLGAPERTLYDRYSQLLQNPAGMSQDPAYQFLFNQGEQALSRTLAARRLSFSGKAMNDTTAYGQGMAYDYMNKLLPQYQAGAQEELRRFMGPAGLLPQYTGANNQVTSKEGSDAASRELLPYYQRMLEQSMGGGGAEPGEGIGYGGLSGGYSQPRLEAAMAPSNYSRSQPPPSLELAGTTYPETVDYSWLDR